MTSPVSSVTSTPPLSPLSLGTPAAKDGTVSDSPVRGRESKSPKLRTLISFSHAAKTISLFATQAKMIRAQMIPIFGNSGDETNVVEDAKKQPTQSLRSQFKLSAGWLKYFGSKENIQQDLFDLLGLFESHLAALDKVFSSRHLGERGPKDESARQWWKNAMQTEKAARDIVMKERRSLLTQPPFLNALVPVLDWATFAAVIQKKKVHLCTATVPITLTMAHLEKIAEDMAIYHIAYGNRSLMYDQDKAVNVPLVNYLRSLTFEPASHQESLTLAWNEVLECWALLGYVPIDIEDKASCSVGNTIVELCYCSTMRNEISGEDVKIDMARGLSLWSNLLPLGTHCVDYSNEITHTNSLPIVGLTSYQHIAASCGSYKKSDSPSPSTSSSLLP